MKTADEIIDDAKRYARKAAHPVGATDLYRVYLNAELERALREAYRLLGAGRCEIGPDHALWEDAGPADPGVDTEADTRVTTDCEVAG